MRKITHYIASCWECEYFDMNLDTGKFECILSQKVIDKDREFEIQEWCELEEV